MTSRILCRLDSNATGDGLTVDDNGLIVTTNRNALDMQRVVLGNLPVSSGVHVFECYVYSNSQGDLSDLVSIGVAEVGSPLDEAVGDNATSLGIRPADGEIWTNGASVNTFDALPERTCIGVIVDFTGPNPIVRWAFNGSSLYFRVLTAGKQWVPAISIGGAEAGDVSVVCNFGQWRFDAEYGHDGWYIDTQGRSTLYLSHAAEGFLSATDDTPSNQPFTPAVLNPGKFSIRRAPQPWVMSGGNGSPGAAAFGTLELDNSSGAFNWLLTADVRGSTIIYQTLPANSETLDDATTQLVARIDSVRATSASVVQVRLRDILADLDVPLPCRIIPPFADESSRGRIWPIGLGAQRNIRPMLLDEPNLIYVLADAPQNNVPIVTDGGAILDAYSAPPQYVPSMNGTAMELDTAPVMRLSADCSNVGTTPPATGAVDVLGGIGDFENWSGGVPVGWKTPTAPPNVVAGGSVTQTSSFGPTDAALIVSNVPMSPYPGSTYMGYPFETDAAYFEPGRSYRLTIEVLRVVGTPDQYGNPNFGLAVLLKLSNDARFWISPVRQPIWQWGGGSYTFEFTVPASEPAALPLILSVISRVQSGAPPTAISATVVVDNVRAQLLGQYTVRPLAGMTLTQAFREILINRLRLPDGCYSTADTDAIDTATGITLGARWESQPNVQAMLQDLADTYCAVIFTDATGVIRVKQYLDPASGTSVAIIDDSNVALSSISIEPQQARGLTTEFGYRRNCEPFAPGDYVTDTVEVPPTQREQWSGVSQGRFSTARQPCSEYAFAVGAPRFHMLCDEREPAVREANRVMAMFEATTALNAKDISGKRLKVNLRAYAPDGMLGAEDQVAIKDIMFGTVLTVNLPFLGLTNKKIGVIEWEPAPMGDWIDIVGDFR